MNNNLLYEFYFNCPFQLGLHVVEHRGYGA